MSGTWDDGSASGGFAVSLTSVFNNSFRALGSGDSLVSYKNKIGLY